MAATNFLNRDVLDVEADIVSWLSFLHVLVMHLDGLNFSAYTVGGKGNNHSWPDNTGLNTAEWHCTDSRDLVDVLEWEAEWLVDWALRWDEGIESVDKDLPGVPWGVGGPLEHVISVKPGNWDE